MSQQIGIVGLGVMGRSLALNFEDHGIPVAVYNRRPEVTDELLAGEARGRNVVATRDLRSLCAALARPRRILLMIKAGSPVDDVARDLRPHLEPGDIVIDGGNSHFADTRRRVDELAAHGLHFFGMGVSGGEEGARFGPSLMPGGKASVWKKLEPLLTKIAARADTGPCVAWVGEGSAGHFVKMVHNGIEYGDMQLIAEAFDLMRNRLGLGHEEIAETFAEWNRGELQSFLVEITARIVAFPDDRGGRGPLLERILDRAGQKGTGKWTTQAALDLGVAIPTITAAVDARVISSAKELRQTAARAFPPGPAAPRRRPRGTKEMLGKIRAALYASKICSYAQGFALLRAASEEYGYRTDLREVARIWKAGCIIRAGFLDDVRDALGEDPALPSLLLARRFRSAIRRRVAPWRDVVTLGAGDGIALPAMSASLAWFDSFRRKRVPAHLIQAQRDLFGAHTYERVGEEGTPVHTDWSRATLPATNAENGDIPLFHENGDIPLFQPGSPGSPTKGSQEKL